MQFNYILPFDVKQQTRLWIQWKICKTSAACAIKACVGDTLLTVSDTRSDNPLAVADLNAVCMWGQEDIWIIAREPFLKDALCISVSTPVHVKMWNCPTPKCFSAVCHGFVLLAMVCMGTDWTVVSRTDALYGLLPVQLAAGAESLLPLLSCWFLFVEGEKDKLEI